MVASALRNSESLIGATWLVKLKPTGIDKKSADIGFRKILTRRITGAFF